ncbi:hypothetical protein BU26DRAFT_504442 [Trematosphaeria pertusa]|uniref:F-box domain-containing protein n=1 Tax=Trematosphaeria pertusa TaxID=390896 RepID=A0A6A6II08_9PLEO|nr:uncharacterized protein BU26DRAFT_504442 [Trematosphaeria pertusa]KAF2250041.1 hypothetical protein BU26DRAFT_504442 [Trematosphaeria pertusa]
MGRQSLFLPDILPCPGPGRCEFHTSIFGGSDDPEAVPEVYSCPRCQEEHPTTIDPPSGSPSPTCPSRLESLPTEILQDIGERVPMPYRALLAFSSRTLHHKLGKRAFDVPTRDRLLLSDLLSRNMPAYATCWDCRTLRPYYSALAWPLLKIHRKERGIPSSIYGVSEFLMTKALAYCDSQRKTGNCFMSLLTCAGTYIKPWADNDKSYAEDAGFSKDDLQMGLQITYEASGRISTKHTADRLVTHVQYRINLPRPWTSFAVAQRFAILRDFYLCPHVYASKVQYRDPHDPTFPADSSIKHWLPHEGPVPEATLTCSKCSAEFRSTVEDDKGHQSITFDVWSESNRTCNDGLTETTFCQGTSYSNGLLGNSKIRGMFESAPAI